MTAESRSTSTSPNAGVLELYRAALGSVGRLREDRLDGFDRTGIPVVSVSWTATDNSSSFSGVGYGSTWDAATIGALGETAEQVVMAATVQALPVTHASYAELVARRRAPAVADPLTLTLPAGSAYTADQQRDWVPTIRWRTGDEVLVPIEFVTSTGSALATGYQPLIVPIGNGLGAGDTIERAVSHAVLELVQRDGDTVSFRALDEGSVIGLSDLTDPDALATLNLLRKARIEPMVKVASTEFACVVYVAARDLERKPVALAVSAMGEAAHPDAQVAIGKALLEYASSRVRRAFAFGPVSEVARLLPDYWALEQQQSYGPQEPRAFTATAEWAQLSTAALRALVEPTLLRVTSEHDIEDLPAAAPAQYADPAQLLRLMLERLAAFDVLVVPGRLGDIHAAKVLAPGLEVETMSYLRIGERVLRRLLDRASPLVGRGEPDRPSRLPILLPPGAAERLGPAWLDSDAVAATVGSLYPLYREPHRHAVQRAAPTH